MIEESTDNGLLKSEPPETIGSLRAKYLERQETYTNYIKPTPHDRDNMRAIANSVHSMLLMAEQMGYIVTVEQAPNTPLSIGNYSSIVSIRAKRIQAS